MDWWTGPSSQYSGPGASSSSSAESTDAISSQQLVDSTGGATVFDPWLNCDDLDLGALLYQAGGAATHNNGDSFVESSTAAAGNRLQHRAVPIQSRLPPGNMGHILNIINNSTANNNNNSQQHQHDINNHHYSHHHESLLEGGPFDSSNSSSNNNNNNSHTSIRVIASGANNARVSASSSSAASPLSSSLGSSPAGHNSASLLTPPHSASSPQNLNSSPNQSSNQDFGSAGATIIAGRQSTGYLPGEYEQQRYHLAQQNDSTLSYGGGVSASGRHQTSATGAKQQQRPIKAEIVRVTPVMVQAKMAGGPRTAGGSSLLTSGPNAPAHTTSTPSAKPSARRLADKHAGGAHACEQQMQLPSGAECGSGCGKKRRRYLGNYVLADEEQELLIKEGYHDFPMTLGRALTKAEERVLRKIRRKIRNKRSAQCSRQRKKEYVDELERKYAAISRENEELRRLLASKPGECAGVTQQQQSQSQLICHNAPLLVGGNSGAGSLSSSASGESSVDQICWQDLFPQVQQIQQEQMQQQQQQQQQQHQMDKQQSGSDGGGGIVYA